MPYSEAETEDRGDVRRSIWDAPDEDRADVKRSIWDSADPPDEADFENERAEAEQRKHEANQGGWFGGDLADYSDARWGPVGTRRYEMENDQRGTPKRWKGERAVSNRGSYRKVDWLSKKRQKVRRKINRRRAIQRKMAIATAADKRKRKRRSAWEIFWS